MFLLYLITYCLSSQGYTGGGGPVETELASLREQVEVHKRFPLLKKRAPFCSLNVSF